MDVVSNVPESQRSDSTAVLDNFLVLRHGKFTVKHMSMTWPKLRLMWEQLQQFRTLFSDLTKGDLDNFLRYVGQETTLWLEIWEEKQAKNPELIGLFMCENLHHIVDIDAHVLFFDRDVSGRTSVCKAIASWLFATLPIQRITVQPSQLAYAAIRLVRNMGFKQEGKKRQALLLGGKWVDVYIFGLTRQEAAHALSDR